MENNKHHLVVVYLNESNERTICDLWIEQPVMYDWHGFKHIVVAEEGFIIERKDSYEYIPPNRICYVTIMKGDNKVKSIDEFATVKVEEKVDMNWEEKGRS